MHYLIIFGGQICTYGVLKFH